MHAPAGTGAAGGARQRLRVRARRAAAGGAARAQRGPPAPRPPRRPPTRAPAPAPAACAHLPGCNSVTTYTTYDSLNFASIQLLGSDHTKLILLDDFLVFDSLTTQINDTLALST